MFIQRYTPEGTTWVSTDDMTDAEQTALGFHKLRRAEEILANSPPNMSMIELQELVRILCVWTGITPPPTP